MSPTMYDFRKLFERFEDDYDQDNIRGTLLSEDELEYVFNFVKEEYEMTISEIYSKAIEDTNWVRGKNSLRMAAIRMYILYQGELPQLMTPNEAWYIIPNTMIQFMESKGFHVEEQINSAREKVEVDTAREKLIVAMAEVGYFYNMAEAKEVVHNLLVKLKRKEQNVELLKGIITPDVMDAITKIKFRFIDKIQNIVREQGLTTVEKVCESEEVANVVKEYVDKAVYFKIKRKLGIER